MVAITAQSATDFFDSKSSPDTCMRFSAQSLRLGLDF